VADKPDDATPEVLVCYAVEDRPFFDKLCQALRKQDRELWTDWQQVVASDRGPQAAMREALSAAEIFLFVVSPASLAEPICVIALEEAITMRRLVVPLLTPGVNLNTLPTYLRAVQSIPFEENDEYDFDAAFKTLLAVVDRIPRQTGDDQPQLVEALNAYRAAVLRDAYGSIRTWYQDNIHLLEGKNDLYSDKSRRLIQRLPHPATAQPAEMKAVMQEVLSGTLEWAYTQSDGEHSMSECARQGTRYGLNALKDSDFTSLEASALWPYLSLSNIQYLMERAKESVAVGDPSTAESFMNQALGEARQSGNLRDVITVEIRLADLMVGSNRSEEALKLFEEALKLSRELGDRATQQPVLLQLGGVYENLGQLDKAKEMYQMAVSIGRELISTDELNQAVQSLLTPDLVVALEHLAAVEQASGNTKEAEEARRQAADLRSRLPQQETKQPPDAPSVAAGHKPPAPSPPTAAPTPKIVSDRWSDRDALGYEAYARTIASLITHVETTPPLTIGIKAPWGAGKTSLMKMVQHLLDGDAQVTEENKAAQLNRQEEPVLTLRGLLRNLGNMDELKKAVAAKALEPKPSEAGKRYGIPPRVTVWFNAWKYQTSEQIWAGLAHCIISQVTARMTPSNRELFWLKLHARRVDTNKIREEAYQAILKYLAPLVLAGFAITGLAALLIHLWFVGFAKWTAVAGALSSVAAGAWKGREKLGDKAAGTFRDLVREPNYEGKLGFLYLVESDIRDVLDLVATPQAPLVIFVDDLDRCMPHKVAEVVEAINLSLCGDYPNCVFVMAMEPGMVAAALEVANKDVIDKAKELSLVESTVPLGWRFMEKIIQLPIIIPPPTDAGVQGYTESLTGAAALAGANEGVPAALPLPVEAKVQEFAQKLEGSQSVAEVVHRTDELLQQAPALDKAAIAEASKRKYAEKFTERDPAIAGFIQSAVPLFKSNPRQIKRYVNVFRFSSTLRHNLRLDFALRQGNRVALPSDEALTKFIALSIQWPQAIDCFRVIAGQADGAGTRISVSTLTLLETKSRSLITADPNQADKDWVAFLNESSFGLGGWAALREFREFLAQGETMGASQGCGLW